MTAVFEAFFCALRDLARPKVFWIMVWPMLVAMLFWGVVGIVFWDTFSTWITYAMAKLGIAAWFEGIEPRWIANGIQILIHVMLFVPVVFTTALVLTAIFAISSLIKVAEQRYPNLRRENGGTIVGNVRNAVVAIAIFILIWLSSIPLWFFGAGFVVPFLAATYLNQRLFRYDAISEHASATEMASLFEAHHWSWWGLGLLTGLLQFVPFLNLMAPVITALAFIHFGLAKLQKTRQNELVVQQIDT